MFNFLTSSACVYMVNVCFTHVFRSRLVLSYYQRPLCVVVDWLREHGVAKASSKLKGREAAEGLIGVKIAEDGASASLVKVSSETDFASRSPAFVSLVSTAVDAALGSNGGDAAGVLDTATLGPSVKEALDEAILAIRENMSVSRAMKFASLEGKYVGYIHGRIDGSEVAGTSAAIVHVAPNSDKEVPGDVMEQVGKKLAMHVVAAKPLYLSPEDVPEEEVEKERTILMQQVRLQHILHQHAFLCGALFFASCVCTSFYFWFTTNRCLYCPPSHNLSFCAYRWQIRENQTTLLKRLSVGK